MRKLLYLAAGWGLVLAGLVLMPAPVPVPLLGVLPLLAGCAILSRHSRRFRRALQLLRHRSAWLSRRMEGCTHRAPESVRAMIRKTHPRAIARRARIDAGKRLREK